MPDPPHEISLSITPKSDRDPRFIQSFHQDASVWPVVTLYQYLANALGILPAALDSSHTSLPHSLFCINALRKQASLKLLPSELSSLPPSLPPALICGPLSHMHEREPWTKYTKASESQACQPCTFHLMTLEVVNYLESNTFDVSFQCFHFDRLSSKPLTVFYYNAAVFLPSPIPHVIYRDCASNSKKVYRGVWYYKVDRIDHMHMLILSIRVS